MKLENRIILNSVTTLQKLVQAELPIKISYILKRNIEELNKQLQCLTNHKNELIQKYGDGKEIKAEDTEAVTKFWNDYNQILDIEEDINIKKIDIDSLNGINISIQELETIMFMLEIDNEG